MSYFFFNDAATTEIYTLSLHDALPISDHRAKSKRPQRPRREAHEPVLRSRKLRVRRCSLGRPSEHRSEEHTSELQSHSDLVCRLLLEKKKEHRPAARPGGARSARREAC